ncbi:MAG TPA: hypothetical protein VMK16_02690, partial [Acidimicrobiales bacterium]|nr:hypothetical protein [Acidimicrobiales bacterium]
MRVGQALGRVVVVGAGVALLAGVSTTARATPALGPPAGWPDLAGAAISPTGLPAGARVSHQGYVKPDSSAFAEYDREFTEMTVKINGKRLVDIEDDVSLARSTTGAD